MWKRKDADSANSNNKRGGTADFIVCVRVPVCRQPPPARVGWIWLWCEVPVYTDKIIPGGNKNRGSFQMKSSC